MNRKKFLKKGLLRLSSIVALPTLASSCSAKGETQTQSESQPIDKDGNESCLRSPSETKGPFPNKTPAELVRENIIGDRKGIPLLIQLRLLEKGNDCKPLANAHVDIWHCDAHGHYSEYGGMRMQRTDYTSEHFLRGRQTSDAEGQVSFISIFPGWYPGRAPHIHLEVFSENGRSLLVSQIGFPEQDCHTVYKTEHYHGPADQDNETDNIFANSLEGNMLDALTGNTTDGYTLQKTIIV